MTCSKMLGYGKSFTTYEVAPCTVRLFGQFEIIDP
jgi:hypothetical protein